MTLEEHLTLELAHFCGAPNTPETRAAICAALERCLRAPPDRLTIEAQGARFVVRTQDPRTLLLLANAGMLTDPTAAGLVRVEGSHGSVWTWPTINP
jgi:hypothetical protein